VWHRLRARLPRLGRTLAVLLAVASAASLGWLVEGPWLRVASVDWEGERFTSSVQLQRLLAGLRGEQLLHVDTASLSAALLALPSVADARIVAVLPDRVVATIEEEPATFVWETSAVRLVGTADGTLIGQLALAAQLPEDLASLPLIVDRRHDSRNIIVGDRIDPELLAGGLRLAALDRGDLELPAEPDPSAAPTASSSAGATPTAEAAPPLRLELDVEYGFVLVAAQPEWRVAFGFYSPQLVEDPRELAARIDAQVAALRTLFETRPPAEVSWVDVRNPGRVYWTP